MTTSSDRTRWADADWIALYERYEHDGSRAKMFALSLVMPRSALVRLCAREIRDGKIVRITDGR